MKKLNRREFVRTTTAAGVAAASIPKTLFGQAPTMMTPKSVKPCVVASANGNSSKDENGVTCVARAFKMITAGSDVLDALVSGVSIVELDPNQTGVGWSGLPNAEGVVQLDSSCMHGPKKRAGAVAAIKVSARRRRSLSGSRTKPITTCSSARARRISPARWA